MKRIILLFFFSLGLLIQTSDAQHTEFGVMLGASTYQGDLAPSTVLGSFGEMHPALGIFGRYNFGRLAAVKLAFNYAAISGDDSKATEIGRVSRNLSFQSNIFELGLTGEWNILGYEPYGLAETFSPYLFGGVAVFRFNPRAENEDGWVDLQPLGTEGQGLSQYPDRQPYKLTQISIPFGLGVKYALNDTWNIGFEFGARKTFTDYLDDVSTTYVSDTEILEGSGPEAASFANRTGEPKETGVGRGDPANNDLYLIGQVFISVNFLDNGLIGSRGRNSRKSGCPTF